MESISENFEKNELRNYVERVEKDVISNFSFKRVEN